jgi:hypothetical protein
MVSVNMHSVEHEQSVDFASSTFTTTEWARLATYRAAVAAGFFTDWDGSAGCTDPEVLAWLPRADAEAYPFTSDERLALEQLRTRLTEGEFADDQPGDGS